MIGPRSLRSLASAAGLLAALATSAVAKPVSVPSADVQALVNARVVVAPGRVLPSATLVLRDGVVAAVGADVAVPDGARTWDATGLTIYPAFVDAHLGLSRLNGKPSPRDRAQGPQWGSDPAPAAKPAGPAPSAVGSGVARVHPEVAVADWLSPDAKALEALRAQGFAAACVVPDDGLFRGRDAVVALGGASPGRSVIRDGEDIHVAFDAGGWGSDDYPSSVMGATAVIRQALLDGDWYRRARQATAGGPRRVDEDASLEALGAVLPERPGARAPGRLAFDCHDVLDVLRAGEIADEFGVRVRVRAAGDEYRRLADVVALGVPLAVPVTFPPASQVGDETEWLGVSDEQLRHWRFAPDNPRWLREAGASVSLTTDGLKDVADFAKRVRRSIERGLRPEDALAMVTTEPAAMLGLGDRLGTLEPGKIANLVVSTGLPFEEGAEIRETWVDGRRHVVSRPPAGPSGSWSVKVTLARGDSTRTFDAVLKVAAADGALSWEKGAGGPGDDGEAAARRAALSRLRVEATTARFDLEGKPFGVEGSVACELVVPEGGEARLSGGELLRGPAVRRVEPAQKKKDAAETKAPLAPPRPVGGALTPQEDVLFTNLTAWTCGPQGIVENAEVLVRGGRIAAVGKGLSRPQGVAVVDMGGRHVTPGLIDAHNHSAIVGGVNEGTNSCTAEVRIGDVVNSETIDIYRQLAGGLTTANLLHGSANCMGGQSQVIRLKWGEPPSGLKFAEAWPMIKFALGENVKQSNWGEKYTTRYPQTRMGVEQFMREKFQEARDWAEHRKAKPARGEAPPRRDLQLECLDEILRGVRKIHCHSYRQDEILGLMRVAEEFGFRVGTFQHILEGYKVADEMAAHGVGGSSFTDWWAFKFEVYDAIPHNPALMWQRGVLTSVNSDSTELARRMQLEAAKVVKWGGVPEAEALKFVTLNAAMQLGVGDRVGSLEPGKDADLAFWSGSPLSTSSRCESTWIQGVKYFDREADVAARGARAAERAALIELAREAQGGDGASGETWSPSYLVVNRGCGESGGRHAHGEDEVQP